MDEIQLRLNCLELAFRISPQADHYDIKLLLADAELFYNFCSGEKAPEVKRPA